jgi:hypothetical protein
MEWAKKSTAFPAWGQALQNSILAGANAQQAHGSVFRRKLNFEVPDPSGPLVQCRPALRRVRTRHDFRERL